MYSIRFSRPFKVVFLLTAVLIIISAMPPEKAAVKRLNYRSEPLAEEQWINQQLSLLSLEEKIAQSFMVACWSNKSEAHLREIERQVEEDHIGGIIFFQGERQNFLEARDRFQRRSGIPLLIGMDAEWGVAMRLFGEERFPYAQTIGAANDPQLTQEIARHMAIESDLLGIHLDFAPVADVNSNPGNPVIGFRAFGSTPAHTGKHVAAFVRGMEKEHVLACLKHFPGHGDTDKDSHLELPTVRHSEEQFLTEDFVPFKQGIDAGASAVMIAHLNVPALDNSGTPSSLSKKVIQDYLRKKLGFRGLVISDALNMKAVSEKYGKSEVVAKAYMAGCDILLFPESVKEAIQLIRKKVESGEMQEAEVDQRCMQVLRAKYRAIIAKPMVKRPDPANERMAACAGIYEKAITVLRNEGNVLPLDRLDKKIARITIGENSYAARESADRYAAVDHFRFYTVDEAKHRLKSVQPESYDVILVEFHSDGQRSRDNYGFENWKSLFPLLPSSSDIITTFFGNPLVLSNESALPENMDACILAYENHDLVQDRVAQFIFGAFDVNGKLETAINEQWKRGDGIAVKGNGRLKYVLPEELGISSEKLMEIDAIVENAIRQHAFPGCQVVVAVKGSVIYRKSFGNTMYDSGEPITDEHVYDIASITKIAASTLSLMKLRSDGKFDTNATLGELVPEIVAGTSYARLNARDMLTHQAGLTPWIPFFKTTLQNGKPDPAIYSTAKKEGFSLQVADSMWIRDDYGKVMMKAILDAPLSGKKVYEYSDLGYYFFKAYIEKATGQPEDLYVQSLYNPLGLRSISYLPLKKFPLNRIVPTEYDREFRHQVIRGYVHDPGAAMLGGVGGHAGLFSNATDLAALMQVLLNKGQIGDFSLIDAKVVEQFTACQFCPKNRRGIGFDKPTVNLKGGPTCSLVSPSSFGHSGFTGTLAWADPEYAINYVFLSNRVYPDADNWKITNMGIRTDIQRVIYEAVKTAK